MLTQDQGKKYEIIIPASGKGKKEIDRLLKSKKQQLTKAINKLATSPINLQIKDIEKLNDDRFGQYSVRVSKGYRLFYDVDITNKKVYLLRVGPHDLYKLL